VGSFGWLLSPAEARAVEHVAAEVARAAAGLSSDGQGALIVLERETGLEEVAETGVMIHGDVSSDLLRTIFTPKSPLHDGAVIIRDERIVAAGALLPLAETSIHTERFGTRHRAALGITEQTDAVVVVVSEENGQISLVERARIVRNLTEAGLARAIQGLLDPAGGRRGAFGWRSATQRGGLDGRSPRLRELGRFVGRPPGASDSQATAVAAPAVAAAAVATPATPATPATLAPSAAPQATPAPATAAAAKPSPPPGPTVADGDDAVPSVAARAPR
jgi:cell division septation protein DedD